MSWERLLWIGPYPYSTLNLGHMVIWKDMRTSFVCLGTRTRWHLDTFTFNVAKQVGVRILHHRNLVRNKRAVVRPVIAHCFTCALFWLYASNNSGGSVHAFTGINASECTPYQWSAKNTVAKENGKRTLAVSSAPLPIQHGEFKCLSVRHD